MRYLLDKFVFVIVGCLLLTSCNQQVEVEETDEEIVDEIVREPELLFGISLDKYDFVRETIQDGWTLSHFLGSYGISGNEIYLADELSRDSAVGLNYIVAGRPFTVFTPKNDTSGKAHFIIYA